MGRRLKQWGNVFQPGGGLIDKNYQPKPAYKVLNRLINEEWITSLDLVTGTQGGIDFRGFHGAYDVYLHTPEGSVQPFDIHLRENESNEWTLTIK